MKHILPLLLFIVLLSACRGSKNYLERSDEDKALSEAVKKLNKSTTDNDAIEAIPVLYKNIVKSRLAKIKSYKSGTDINRWDQVINEYNQLQDAYHIIINSTPAFKLVSPQNFSIELLEAKQQAAEDYYVLAESFFTKQGRENAKKAYSYYKKADRYIPGYKDAITKMQDAYENAIVSVVINPIQDNSYFYNSGWGSQGYDYSNEYFQRTLLRDLSTSNNNSNYAARFYSDWQAQRENIQPHWIVDLRLNNMQLPQPSNYTYRRNRNANVQTGTDTLGKPIYKTVYATLNITRMSFTARADMSVQIKDLTGNRYISNRQFREDYRWQEEKASYSGNSAALTSEDWAMINNSRFYAPRREDVLNELYKKLYPQVLNNIRYAVNW